MTDEDLLREAPPWAVQMHEPHPSVGPVRNRATAGFAGTTRRETIR
jgi:hypothetical protein